MIFPHDERIYSYVDITDDWVKWIATIVLLSLTTKTNDIWSPDLVRSKRDEKDDAKMGKQKVRTRNWPWKRRIQLQWTLGLRVHFEMFLYSDTQHFIMVAQLLRKSKMWCKLKIRAAPCSYLFTLKFLMPKWLGIWYAIKSCYTIWKGKN